LAVCWEILPYISMTINCSKLLEIYNYLYLCCFKYTMRTNEIIEWIVGNSLKIEKIGVDGLFRLLFEFCLFYLFFLKSLIAY
jgi:hypothetical protein